MRRLVLSACAAGLAACIYLPRTTEVYDADCRIRARHMDLQAEQIGLMARCSNEGCAALLAGMGAVSVASAVVSGSIVVAGNAVYWFEKWGNCQRSEAVAPQTRARDAGPAD